MSHKYSTPCPCCNRPFIRRDALIADLRVAIQKHPDFGQRALAGHLGLPHGTFSGTLMRLGVSLTALRAELGCPPVPRGAKKLRQERPVPTETPEEKRQRRRGQLARAMGWEA